MLPIDRSKPSTASVKVTPTPRIATTATACSTENRLLMSRKAGSASQKPTIIAASSTNRPALRATAEDALAPDGRSRGRRPGKPRSWMGLRGDGRLDPVERGQNGSLAAGVA